MTDTLKLGEADEVESSRAPLLEHLTELRSRLIRAVVAIIAGFAVSLFFAKPILVFLLRPWVVATSKFDAVNADLQATALLEQFFVYMKISLFGGFVIGFPVIAYQLYRFIAPGLYRNERGAFLPYLFISPVLFILGSGLVFTYVFPYVLEFALRLSTSFQGEEVAINLVPRIENYLSLAIRMFLAFGFSFQLPVVLSLLGRAGILGSDTLKAGRRYAVVAIAAFAAVMTPPDPLTQIVLGSCIYLLYEVSIVFVRLAERKHAD